MAWTDIQKVKIEIADLDPTFPLLSDDTYAYYLEKNNNSIPRTALDAARTVLMMLSQRSDETVDIFSIRGSKTAETYRLALQMYIKDQYLNPMNQNLKGYIGGTSLSDMQANDANTDNNIISSPSNSSLVPTGTFSSFPTKPFEV